MKRALAFLLAVIVFVPCVFLASCKPSTDPDVPGPTEKPASTRDVNYPTEVPSFGEDAIQIHYQRKDEKYSTWGLWLWDPDGDDDGEIDTFDYMDDYGVIAAYPLSHFGELSGGKLGIIIRKLDSWTKDGTEADRFIEINRLTKDANGFMHIYFAGDDPNIYTSPEKIIIDEIKSADFLDGDSITVSATAAIEKVTVYCNGEKVGEFNGAGRKAFSLDLPKDHAVSFGSDYTITAVFRESGAELSAPVGKSGLYKTDEFNNLYYYDGELGAIWTPESTEFKVWSPVAEKIVLRIYDNGTPVSVSKEKGSDAFTEHVMTLGDKGVWSVKLDGNQEGKYYTYFVTTKQHPDGKEIVDPYARSCGVNGVRGMVVDFSKTDPEGWDDVKYLNIDRKALTVYETHVADVTSSSTWGGTPENAKKFLGLIEKGTTYTENGTTVTTGFDHIVELGVNAVQLIPVFDQANNEVTTPFNWGYNPLNYNVVEGCYSSDPYDGYVRIRELKEVVKAFGDAGITVIMDVVYNHVNGAVNSNWDVLMPGYYYRYTATGALSNGSGCGNEVASENAMVRKFIIDSVTFWMKEYKLGGFRFDLMGLHDIETMDQLTAALKEINANAVVYGEPWTGGGTTLSTDEQAKQSNASKFEGYGQFNDQMRDALIKGGLSGPSEKGWITNTSAVSKADVTSIVEGINGATHNATNDPNKTVNYVTCHDNYTLYDRIKAAGITDEDTVKKMAMLANGVVFTSSGTTFMLAGEEFLRTKQGNSNSYNASYELNALDYSLKVKNYDVFLAYRMLIGFKQACGTLHLDEPSIDVKTIEDGAVLMYTLDDQANGCTYVVIHANGTSKGAEIQLPDGEFKIYYDSEAPTDALKDTVKYASGTVTATPFRTVILYRNVS